MFAQYFRLSVLVAAGIGSAFGSSIGSVVVYGDSLSDNGNLYAVVQQPGAPYYGGRLSNGPVAVEQLASKLNVPLFDFAYAGATTGVGNEADFGTPTSLGIIGLPGMLVEYASAASGAAITANAANGLFIVWGGPNDFLSPSPSDTTPTQIVDRAVGDLLLIVNGLRAQGVTNILVPGMPDLGLTPAFLSQGALASAQGTALSNLFNATLTSQLPAGTKYFDTANLLRTIVGNPGAYGFTDVTDACFTGTTLCSNPDSYLFFDGDHPTTYADSILAQNFLLAAVPEPASIWLTAGAVCIFGARRKILHLTRYL